MKIIELPREAYQSMPAYIPPDVRASYLNALLKVGFDTVEIGSITSARILPQMQGTLEILDLLKPETDSNIMVLVLNKKGADFITQHEKVSHISFPFAVSPQFLKKNTNSTVEETLKTTAYIVNLCHQHNKTPIVYFSMAFGNPYGEEWNLDLALHWIAIMRQMGISIIPLSNVSIPLDQALISQYYSTLIPAFPEIEFGLHLHTTDAGAQARIHAAYSQGCRRFDGVINGLGGCPMASDEMLGNLNTRELIRYFREHDIPYGLNQTLLEEAYRLASSHFIHS